MKKVWIACFTMVLSIAGWSQTCEQREEKLLGSIGSFSAALLYNTYGVIGAIGDGYGSDAYDRDQLNSLLESQKKLADNLVVVLEELNKNTIKDQSDKDYAIGAISILKGLKRQAQLLQDYAKSKSKQKQEDYDEQRKKNWKEISKLMRIEE